MEPVEVLVAVLLLAFLASKLPAASVPLVLAVENAYPLDLVSFILALVNLALVVLRIVMRRTSTRRARTETGSTSGSRSSQDTPAPQSDLATDMVDGLARNHNLEVSAGVVEEQQCTICLGELLDGGVKTLACQHEFHEECIEAWLNKHSNCPICRATVCLRCTICLGEWLDGGVKTLACRHEFHEECLDKWLNEEPSCPICRAMLLI